MRLFAHLDPHTLEAHLLARVAIIKRDDPLAAVLVIVPSRRLADHLTRRIGEHLGAAIGIEILFHRALTSRVLEHAGRPSPRPAGQPLLEALLDDILRELQDRHPLAAFIRSRAGASAALLGSLVELREAGCRAPEVAAGAESERERDVAAIYSTYTRRLETLRDRGLVDDAARAAEALPHAAAFAGRFARIFHHGAYELVGVNLDLVRALDSGREVEMLLPIAPGREVSAYAEEFARRFLLSAGTAVEAIDAPYLSCLGDRLAALFDDGARPAPLPESRWSLASTQGASTELTWALRRTAAAVGAGTPAHEAALIARTWAPYSAAMLEMLDEGALPCDAAVNQPLRREPLVREFIAALRVIADDFPRAATAELLRSPRISWHILASVPGSFPGPSAEGWSREAGIVRGLASWTEELPEWASLPRLREDASEIERGRRLAEADERGRAARAIAAAVEALAGLIDRQAPLRWSEHADAVTRLAERLYGDSGRGETVLLLLDPVLEATRDRERLLGDADRIPFAAFVAWLERASDALPAPASRRPGAIALVDAMQARGTTYARVYLAGLQSGLFPRIPREDPFMSDPFRRRIREATSRPLPIKLEADREEHLILALALGAAKDEIELSWPRADEDGRAKATSPVLREIARVLLGTPNAKTLRERAFAVPSHPRARLEAIAAHAGLLTAPEEMALIALQAEGRVAGRAPLLARGLALAPRLELSAVTESFAPDDLRFDARVAPAPPRAFSVTGLETLGRCALQFFFREVLRVRPLVEEPSPLAASAREMGAHVHLLLQSVYGALIAEDAFARHDAAGLVARGDELLTEHWERTVGVASRRIARTLPGLHAIQTSLWTDAVRRFVAEDLTALSKEGAAPVALEQAVDAAIDFGDGEVRIRGRFDRMTMVGEKSIVADYKTAGDLEKRVDAQAILRGERLQVALYRELSKGARVELLGVGPAYDAAPDGARRVIFDGFPDARIGASQHQGLRETLRVLVRLASHGIYPMRRGRQCSYCDWRGACRHGHPATIERHENAADGADYRALEEKTKTKPLLSNRASDSPPEDSA